MKGSVLFFVLTVFVAGYAAAQNVDYKKIILPDDALNTSFEERLVQLAWRNNPESHLAAEGVTQSREEAKVAGNQWTNMIGVQGNLNEFSIKQFTNNDQTQANQFFPRYNFYLQLPLSTVLQMPHTKRAADSKKRQAEERVNLLKLDIRSRVLKLYSDYKTAETIVNLRKQTVDDEDSNYLLIEQRFKNGEASVEDYLAAQRNRNELRVALAQTQNTLQKAKLDLEAMIGVKLEDVR
jgi:outer membrane protein TolC